MKTIVFIGSCKSGSSCEALRAAEELQYYTVLLTAREPGRMTDFPHAHSVRVCDIDRIGEVRSAIRQLQMNRLDIRAVVSFIDPYCHTAAVLARELGLRGFSEAAIAAMQDKIRSRKLLAGTPCTPFFRVADSPLFTADMARHLPLVLKSPVSSSSRDVHRVCTYKQYKAAFERLRAQYPGAPVLAEQYLDGPQYLTETLAADGRVRIAAVVEQEITYTGRFIITGYRMVTERDSEPHRSLETAAASILNAYGMRDGPCHLELRRAGGGWGLIEANPRIAGGAMNLFIQTAYGVDLVKETLKFALGQEPDLTPEFIKEAFLQYVVVPAGGTLVKVTGKQKAQESPGAEHVYVKPRKGQVLYPPSSMGHRYAYVIATGASAEEARKNARAAAANIVFHLRPAGADSGVAAAGDLKAFAGHVAWVRD
ncbi:MAG: ATP-grasp domain-containing protein [Oscillospiraceae bacterium]|nr:ATP-grasp domain-containing protein [Oscillospiraceae bacterium]